VALVSRDISNHFARLHPKPIELAQEVSYFRRRIGISTRSLERMFLGCVIARDEPIPQFKLGWIAETHINEAVRDVVSLTGKPSASALALKGSATMKPAIWLEASAGTMSAGAITTRFER
jgi:hypothetical protein